MGLDLWLERRGTRDLVGRSSPHASWCRLVYLNGVPRWDSCRGRPSLQDLNDPSIDFNLVESGMAGRAKHQAPQPPSDGSQERRRVGLSADRDEVFEFLEEALGFRRLTSPVFCGFGLAVRLEVAEG